MPSTSQRSGRLGGLHDHADLARKIDGVEIPGDGDHVSVIPCVSHHALDLGEAALPYYDELIPLAPEAFGGVMDLLDIGARGIQDIDAAGTGILDDTRHDAVGTNDERALLDLALWTFLT